MCTQVELFPVLSSHTIETYSVYPLFKTVDYLIVVHSRAEYLPRRQAIRETFGRGDLFRHLTAKVVFLVGLPPKVRYIRSEERLSSVYYLVLLGYF